MRTFLLAMAITLAACATALNAADDLTTGFTNPPISAHPQTWWHWMNGNITKEGITADLEAMKRVGIVEANIITVASDIPPGPVTVMSPKFFDMVEFAAKEADRLGMTLCMDNCPGWSSSGGPWVKPQNAMQMMTSSEKQVTGPMKFVDVLAQPSTKLGFYRDIAVLAFKTPSANDENGNSSDGATVISSVDGLDCSQLIKAGESKEISFPLPLKSKPSWVQIGFDQPHTFRVLMLTQAPRNLAWSGAVEISDDGTAFRKATTFNVERRAGKTITVSLGEGPVTAKFFRLQFIKATQATGITIDKIRLSRMVSIADIRNKAGFGGDEVDPRSVEKSGEIVSSADEVIPRDGIINLTGSMKPDGTLTWDVPAGNWTIQRFGYTPTGVTNHPAPPEATGLECDKLSKSGLDASWNGMMQPILDRLGPLGGKILRDCLIDSYETGGQNWTPAMVEEFKTRRGYDPTPYLPVMLGNVVDSPAVSERFLWDMRRTIADLFADNYFGYFTTLCHQHGMKSLIEPYTGPFESLQSGSMNDVPMGEFWAGSESQNSVPMAASIGHIYGQRVIGAESFTGAPDHGRWTDDPYSLKALGDLAFTQGINRYIFHRFTHQPWMDKFPGMTMGQWGINLDRTNTWFEKAKPWMDYISRSQFLLQQGMYVGDIAYFCGQSAPVVDRRGTPKRPPGFADDAINADVLLHHAHVVDHHLALDDGMKYAVLVLPESDPEMTPELAKVIRDFVNDGLTVVGPKPVHSLSLQNYPQCDQDVKTVADQAWGDCDGKTVTEHTLGQGKVVWGKPLADVFSDMKLPADFDKGSSKAPLLFIHRNDGDTDIYFVANHGSAFVTADCTFRITGKVPELWHPDTGVIESVAQYNDKDGRITLPLQLDPSGSVFIVFRNAPASEHIVDVTKTTPPEEKATEQPKLTIRKASYQAISGGGAKDVTAILAELAASGSIDMSVDNSAFGGDPAINIVKQLVVDYTFNGKDDTITVPENGHLQLPTGPAPEYPAGYALRHSADGSLQVLALRSGSFSFTLSTGKTVQMQIPDVQKPTAMDGPWELRFPPNWGAPPSVTLDKLISWSDHENAGVKYFSGTATYTKEINIPAEQLGAGHELFLNLGAVKNFAEVKINGTDLGILWKPPFRADITAAAKTGVNKLEIDVTNLWPNRIIGDAQLPDDLKWAGMKPAAWPQWLLDGKPSPSGRFTFTTWRHWTKDDHLLPSGILGPVEIQSAEWKNIEQK